MNQQAHPYLPQLLACDLGCTLLSKIVAVCSKSAIAEEGRCTENMVGYYMGMRSSCLGPFAFDNGAGMT